MKSVTLSFLTNAISFPGKLFSRDDWPVLSYEEAETPGNWIHRQNSYWVTTVRYNANFFAKAFAFQTVVICVLGVAAAIEFGVQ